MNTENLTHTQLKKKISSTAKRWLKEKGYTDEQIKCTRGTFHATNGVNYMLSCKYILETSTGLEFVSLNSSMARLK